MQQSFTNILRILPNSGVQELQAQVIRKVAGFALLQTRHVVKVCQRWGISFSANTHEGRVFNTRCGYGRTRIPENLDMMKDSWIFFSTT